MDSRGYIASLIVQRSLQCFFFLKRCPKEISHLFFFNDTATTEIYTLSLHDALPILPWGAWSMSAALRSRMPRDSRHRRDQKSTRLNSSHSQISYAVFCLKKKKKVRPQFALPNPTQLLGLVCIVLDDPVLFHSTFTFA